MIQNIHKVDDIDQVMLISAMMVANGFRAPNGEGFRVPVGELGEFLTVATTALMCIAILHRVQPDDWDGVLWYEFFADASEGSIADTLVDLVAKTTPTAEEIRSAVIGWLKAAEL